jgi:hypothetical protein
MTRHGKYKKVEDNGADSALEIWSAIRYLDPDTQLRNRDVGVGVICAVWIAVFLSIFLFFYLLHH